MKNEIKNRLQTIGKLAACYIIISTGSAFAASGAGETSGDFLLIGMGARSAGVGGAYTAMTEGAASAYWNPAALAGTDGGQVSLDHYRWYQDISVNHVAFGYGLNEKTAFSISAIYLDYGSIQGRDQYGVETGEIAAYDMALCGSVARSLTDKISIGATGKYVSQHIEEMNAFALAADFGVSYDGGTFAVAAVVANVGTDMTYRDAKEPLPTAARVGVSLAPFTNSFRTSIEVEDRFNGDMVLHNGFEFNYNQQYFLRTGYNYYPQDDSRSFGTGLSFGAGLRYQALEFDYAYTLEDAQTKDALHRFSVSFGFGQN